jgi:XRE family transcriptional regulator, master regulator for biofilm formation
MGVGDRIKQLRINKNYSITKLSNKAHVSKSYLSYIERGIQENPSLQVLSRLANILEVSLEELTGQPPKDPAAIAATPIDPEWFDMVEEAIRNGVSKEEFAFYIDFVKYKKDISK